MKKQPNTAACDGSVSRHNRRYRFFPLKRRISCHAIGYAGRDRRQAGNLSQTKEEIQA